MDFFATYFYKSISCDAPDSEPMHSIPADTDGNSGPPGCIVA
jgi:hypothetical protein